MKRKIIYKENVENFLFQVIFKMVDVQKKFNSKVAIEKMTKRIIANAVVST